MATGTKGMEQTVAALGRMTLGRLREKYLELFGEPTRSGNRDFLFKRLAWRLTTNVAAAPEDWGDEQRRRRAALGQRGTTAHKVQPPTQRPSGSQLTPASQSSRRPP